MMVPTANLIELDDEMHNISVSSPSPSGHYDSPHSRSMKVKSNSASRLEHPVPKPRQKLPQKACSVDVVEENFKQPVISSQYSRINVDYDDPNNALVINSHPEQYINKRNSYYENIGYDVSSEQRYVTVEGPGRYNDSAGELVLQTGGSANAFGRAPFMPHSGIPENNGAAAMTSNQLYGHHQILQPPPPGNQMSNEIRYPPPLVDRVPSTLPTEPEGHQYDTLRYAPQDELNSQTLPAQTNQSNLTPSPPSASSPHVRKRTGKYANLVDGIKKELPQANEEMCIKYLKKNKGNVEQTMQDLKVHILMEMKLENANMESCRKALGHCQWKLDRAAEWLIEQSLS